MDGGSSESAAIYLFILFFVKYCFLLPTLKARQATVVRLFLDEWASPHLFWFKKIPSGDKFWLFLINIIFGQISLRQSER